MWKEYDYIPRPHIILDKRREAWKAKWESNETSELERVPVGICTLCIFESDVMVTKDDDLSGVFAASVCLFDPETEHYAATTMLDPYFTDRRSVWSATNAASWAKHVLDGMGIGDVPEYNERSLFLRYCKSHKIERKKDGAIEKKFVAGERTIMVLEFLLDFCKRQAANGAERGEESGDEMPVVVSL